MLSPLANIFTCKSWISAENKAVFSETEVVFIRGSLTQTLSLCVTLSLFLYLPVLFHSRCQNYPRNWEGKRKKKTQAGWKDETLSWNCTQRHSPPTSASPRMLRFPTRSRPTLHTNTWVAEESAFALTQRTVERSFAVRAGGESLQITERAPASPQSTNKQQASTVRKRPEEGETAILNFYATELWKKNFAFDLSNPDSIEKINIKIENVRENVSFFCKLSFIHLSEWYGRKGPRFPKLKKAHDIWEFEYPTALPREESHRLSVA